MFSNSSHIIKKRQKPNDIFITPLELAYSHIKMIESDPSDKWLDPCRNDGSYYNQIETDKKDYCEILENKDFFNYYDDVDIIIQNPPYSILDKWINKNIELNPRIITFLIGINNLTTRRITKLKMLKVWKWYGMSVIVIFEKNKKSIIQFDRKIYR